MKRYLIVKTSSLGDIVHAFDVLHYMEGACVDWIVDQRFASLVRAHPRIHSTLAFDRRHLFDQRFLAQLRTVRYDTVFDLQGNCKSALFTWASRSKEKVGFSYSEVREWPNLLATNIRYSTHARITETTNIRDYYTKLVALHLKTPLKSQLPPILFSIDKQEQERLNILLSGKSLLFPLRVMVCLHSNWFNKQPSLSFSLSFLSLVQKHTHCFFFFTWGSPREHASCAILHAHFPDCSVIVDSLPVPTWRHLMTRMDLVLAVDSGALHLCGTTPTPSFSLFGPTSATLFNPRGALHGFYQGRCPYHQLFTKTCPYLRSCPTGACLQELDSYTLFDSFQKWFLSQKTQGFAKGPRPFARVEGTESLPSD